MKIVAISKQKPPHWILDEVKEKFGVVWESSVIFTYGNVISSSAGMMTEDLLAHEKHHTIQQSNFGGADKWWREYLDNEQFRLDQELECYRKQYKWLKANIKDRNEVFRYLEHYANSLSGEMYGNLLSKSEARALIIVDK